MDIEPNKEGNTISVTHEATELESRMVSLEEINNIIKHLIMITRTRRNSS